MTPLRSLDPNNGTGAEKRQYSWRQNLGVRQHFCNPAFQKHRSGVHNKMVSNCGGEGVQENGELEAGANT